MKKRIADIVRRKIRLFKQIHPKARLREMQEYVIKNYPEYKKIQLGTIRLILAEKDEVEDKIVEKAKDEYIKTSSKQLAKIMSSVDKNETQAMAKAINILNREMDKVTDPIEALKIYTELKKLKYGGMETRVEMIFTPEQVKKFENLYQLVDETIKQKTTPTLKISQRITGDVDRPTEADEGGIGTDSSSEQEPRGQGED